MTAPPEIIYVCTNVDCRSRGSLATMERLKAQLGEQGIEVSIEPIVCFSACNAGPNVVIPGKRCWLSGVTPDKVQTVIEFLKGGGDISALQAGNDPVLEQMIFEMIDAGLLEKAG
jgi:(2Fe-2S) ferredoxin